jgi:predicted TIM-barrel fold metal-dependent hydrolase
MTGSMPCDSHVHVFDPERYPFAASRKFTPDTANAQQLTHYLDRTGIQRVVLVQPSVYGTNNLCLLNAIEQLNGRAKGVAVISKDSSRDELDALMAAGVVGARLNMVVNRSFNAEEAAIRIEELDALLPKSWHIQLHVTLGVLAGIARTISRSNRLFVLDHLGLPSVEEGTESPLWQKMLAMTRTGQLCVKLSGPYLSSKLASPYSDLRPYIDSLADTNAEAILWGSNWPHTQGVHRSESDDPLRIEKFRDENDSAWPAACTAWLGKEIYEHMQLNAARVYGFDR